MKEEKDPSGLNPGDAGAKLDQGKIRVGLLRDFGLALMAVGELSTKGAEKYSDGGWAEVENGIERYTDAGFGHLLRENFEEFDSDTDVNHAVAVAWNFLARLQLMIMEDPEWEERLESRRLP